MTTILEAQTVGFESALVATQRAAEIPEANDVYGWLIGGWELDCYDYFPDGRKAQSNGEVQFAWVLEGRAVQDIWIMPRRAERPPKDAQGRNTYGTTLRVWDPKIEAWRVTWINPISGNREELIGRRQGKDIVQVGARPNGQAIRWAFTEITPDSFHWTGEALDTDGKTWKLEAEFFAKRIKGAKHEER